MSVLSGIAGLARFRIAGFAGFGATPQAFLNSLAPLLAFPLVGGVLSLLGGSLRDGALDMLSSLIAVLAPAVISHAFASLWRRDAFWLRYAVAFNWCQSAITLVTIAAVVFVETAPLGRAGAMTLLFVMVLAVLAYWLMLCGFMASRGLRLSTPRAILLVLVTNIATAMLVMGPRLLAVV
jgi:hypothetical protein